MNMLKPQSYSLSPDQYLEKFRTPHQVISQRGDREADQRDGAVLNELLNRYYDDSPETSERKERSVGEVERIVKKWMFEVAQSTSNDPDLFEEAGYGLKVFGSYRLKTNSYDGDIDMICLVPEYFSRQTHFFKQLAGLFRLNPDITEVFAIPDALVPLIRLTLLGVQIDFLLARVRESYMREHKGNLQQASRGGGMGASMNERQLRSLNGYRTALYLNRQYVEQYDNYRVTLKAVKLWAKNKGIYSQIYGYLGGAALSIMLAKICQLYPKYSPLQLLDRFFFIFGNWVWTIPVLVQRMEYMECPQSQMVVFTPLDPHMNAAHSVSKITCAVTRKQLRLASKLIQDINKGKREWQDLFKPLNFFKQYANFIEISVMGDGLEEFGRWKGNVQSKMRKFIQNLEGQSELSHGVEVHPYPRGFPSKHPHFSHCHKYYIGLKASPNTPLNDYSEIDLAPSVRNFLELLESYPQIDKAPQKINIGFNHLPRNALPAELLTAFHSAFGAK